MSSNRTNSAPNRAFKPALASTRTLDRSPLTPRLAPSSTHSAPLIATRSTPISTPKIKHSQDSNELAAVDNITPRSAKRRSRVESSNTTPTQSLDSPSIPRATTISPLALSGDPVTSINGRSLSRPTIARSPLSDTAALRAHAPFVRSSTGSEVSRVDDSIDSRFFHASDITKVESEPKRPEPRKAATFFYADGQQEQRSRTLTRATSPARSDKLSSPTTWNRSSIDSIEASQVAKSTPMLSPALSAISSTSPFFASAVQIATQKPRSPSPSKENIHLSYRKGASQIFGSRPSPIPTSRPEVADRRPSFQRAFHPHKKSPSLSSIDSGLSERSRRRSNTAQDTQGSSTLREEPGPGEAQLSPATPALPSIETSRDLSGQDAGPLSPSKSISELAADARRERKVLDLEISNSSLLAINASLERELRRQKMELKRFRRLSRAGRFSFNPLEERRASSSPGMLDEAADGIDHDFADFGPASGLSELYEDISDSDDGNSLASSEPGANAEMKVDRLAKDERRLRADLDKHRELLVQSQMMNQSLRRCMYATEEMIKEGKKAVDYNVRVSDVKLGGRILTGHEEEDEDGHAVEEIEVEDDLDSLSLASPLSHEGVDDHAQNFVELWGGIGKLGHNNGAGKTSIEDSEPGDRDSGIEVDRPVQKQDVTI